MKITGEKFIGIIRRRLDDESIRTYDSAIVEKIITLTEYDMCQLFDLTDICKGHNERVNKEPHEDNDKS